MADEQGQLRPTAPQQLIQNFDQPGRELAAEPVKKHEPIAGPMPHTPEWHKAHRVVFGASDAAALLGFDRYRTAAHVYAEHSGEVEPKQQTEEMEMGLRMEPVICDSYAKYVGVPCSRPLPMYFHPQYSFLGATPDARRTDGRLVELKLTGAAADELGEEYSDWIPQEWLCQTQQQMAVMGETVVDVAAMVVLFGRLRLRVFTGQRVEELINGIIEAAKEMRDRLVRGDPPEPDWTHPRTPELIKAIYGLREGTTIQLDEETTKVWLESELLGQKRRELEKAEEVLKAKVRNVVAEAAIAVLHGGRRELVRRLVPETEIAAHTRRSYVTIRARKRR